MIRERLKKQNGFEWAGYNFYPVLDEDDKVHTFDDVVRNNIHESSSLKEYLPEGFVAIAIDDLFCLCLNTNKDGKLYYYNTGDIEVVAENEEEVEAKLNELDKEFNGEGEEEEDEF